MPLRREVSDLVKRAKDLQGDFDNVHVTLNEKCNTLCALTREVVDNQKIIVSCSEWLLKHVCIKDDYAKAIQKSVQDDLVNSQDMQDQINRMEAYDEKSIELFKHFKAACDQSSQFLEDLNKTVCSSWDAPFNQVSDFSRNMESTYLASPSICANTSNLERKLKDLHDTKFSSFDQPPKQLAKETRPQTGHTSSKYSNSALNYPRDGDGNRRSPRIGIAGLASIFSNSSCSHKRKDSSTKSVSDDEKDEEVDSPVRANQKLFDSEEEYQPTPKKKTNPHQHTESRGRSEDISSGEKWLAKRTTRSWALFGGSHEKKIRRRSNSDDDFIDNSSDGESGSVHFEGRSSQRGRSSIRDDFCLQKSFGEMDERCLPEQKQDSTVVDKQQEDADYKRALKNSMKDSNYTGSLSLLHTSGHHTAASSGRPHILSCQSTPFIQEDIAKVAKSLFSSTEAVTDNHCSSDGSSGNSSGSSSNSSSGNGHSRDSSNDSRGGKSAVCEDMLSAVEDGCGSSHLVDIRRQSHGGPENVIVEEPPTRSKINRMCSVDSAMSRFCSHAQGEEEEEDTCEQEIHSQSVELSQEQLDNRDDEGYCHSSNAASELNTETVVQSPHIALSPASATFSESEVETETAIGLGDVTDDGDVIDLT